MRNKILYVTGWTLLILLNMSFVAIFPARYFTSASLNAPYGPFLLTHIVFGMIAILIGPFQFFPSIRKNRPKLHRLTGRIYLSTVVISAVASIIYAVGSIIILRDRPVYGTGLLGLAVAWLATSGLAFWAIRNRNFVQHREWMVKSYVVTCGFTTFRLFAGALTFLFGQDFDEMATIMAWASWSIPLLVTEAVIQSSKVRRSKPATFHS
jgi:uncharacterized membrane protein